MFLERLDVSYVRNLQPFSLVPSPRFNLFSGPNGAGKTSILEAIHLLTVGKSFRTHLPRRLISEGQKCCTVFTTFDGHQCGMEKSVNGDTLYRLDGINVPLYEVVSHLPVATLNPEFMGLLDEGSKPRRQLMDWGLFHVEQSFFSLWQRYQRALKQRNSLLRSGNIDPLETTPWDQELGRTAEKIHELRVGYVSRLTQKLNDFLKVFIPYSELTITYTPGWDVNQSLVELLATHFERDRERGYTQNGPHRADLSLRVGHVAADEVLSRGQKKMAVCALKLAQVSLVKDVGKTPLMLVDDLPSELDADARQRLCGALIDSGCQVWLTAVTAEPVLECLSGQVVKLFHVEHGVVRD